MVHSMTAFARVESAGTQGTLSWELRSVNSRYLEPHLRLPESFRDLEGAVREALRAGISRGKLECTLRFTEDELHYLGSLRYIKRSFVDFLRMFQFQRQNIKV